MGRRWDYRWEGMNSFPFTHLNYCEHICILYLVQSLSSLLKGSAWQAASEWLYVVPWGIHKVLNYIAQRYNNPPIYITENGMHGQTFLRGNIILLFQCNMIFHPRCSFINGHPLKNINFSIRIGYYRTFCILSMVWTNIISRFRVFLATDLENHLMHPCQKVLRW